MFYFLRTPVFEGSVMAVDKKHFVRLGKFDAGLENWGAASLGKLYFKIL